MDHHNHLVAVCLGVRPSVGGQATAAGQGPNRGRPRGSSSCGLACRGRAKLAGSPGRCLGRGPGPDNLVLEAPLSGWSG